MLVVLVLMAVVFLGACSQNNDAPPPASGNAEILKPSASPVSLQDLATKLETLDNYAAKYTVSIKTEKGAYGPSVFSESLEKPVNSQVVSISAGKLKVLVITDANADVEKSDTLIKLRLKVADESFYCVQRYGMISCKGIDLNEKTLKLDTAYETGLASGKVSYTGEDVSNGRSCLTFVYTIPPDDYAKFMNESYSLFNILEGNQLESNIKICRDRELGIPGFIDVQTSRTDDREHKPLQVIRTELVDLPPEPDVEALPPFIVTGVECKDKLAKFQVIGLRDGLYEVRMRFDSQKDNPHNDDFRSGIKKVLQMNLAQEISSGTGDSFHIGEVCSGKYCSVNSC